jgi:hypothetical protein
MIENVLHDLGGIGLYGVISICLFFGFFAGMVIWVLCLKKSYLTSMRELPLDGDGAHPARSANTSNSQEHHE